MLDSPVLYLYYDNRSDYSSVVVFDTRIGNQVSFSLPLPFILIIDISIEGNKNNNNNNKNTHVSDRRDAWSYVHW